MKAKSAFPALGLVLALAPGARATVEANEVPITLAEALDLAVRANPELQADAARVDAQAARAEAVRRSRRPRLGLAMDWVRTDQPAGVFASRLDAGRFAADSEGGAMNDPDALGHLGTSLSLEVPVDPFGKTRRLATAAAAERDAASAGARDAVLEVRLRVIEAYRQADLAGRTVAVVEGVLAVARAREAEIEARVEAGGVLQADLLRARVRRRDREAELAERTSRRRMAEAGLDRLLGAPAGTSYRTTGGPGPVDSLQGDEAAWVERALRERPGLESARRRAAAASAVARHEKSGRLPDVDLFGQVRDDRIEVSHGKQSFSVGLTLRWRLLDPSRRTRETAAAAEERAAAFDARAASDQVRLEVVIAYRRAVSARARHAATVGGLEEGWEAFRVVQERRKAGLATLTDELDTETAALGAALQEIAAAAEVAVADAALRRAAGEL